MFYPFGVAVLAACAAVCRSKGHQVDLVLPENESARDFALEVGLDRFVRGEQTGVGTLELRQLHGLDGLYTEQVTEMLTRGVPGMDDVTSYPIQMCLNELLVNVRDWSRSGIGAIVLARWYRNTSSVRLSVVDRGIGIPGALRELAEFRRRSDVELVEAAVTQPGLTSRTGRPGGLGLKNIREIVCERAGRLTVVSGAAKVSWEADQVKRSRMSDPSFHGTAIEIDFRPAPSAARPERLEVF